jgi:hypothetical protein
MRASLFLLGVLVLSACGNVTYLPDGGRARQVCAGARGSVPVKVVNSNGDAIEGVTVTATHSGTGTVTTGKTDVNGNTDIVNSDLGDGVIHVVANLPPKSAAQEVNLTCGECICTAYPATVTLTLQ